GYGAHPVLHSFPYTTLFRSVEDVGPRLDHGAHRVEVALEVGCQHLDRRPRASSPDGADRAREYAGAAVPQVVTIDGSDDRVLEPELSHGLGDANGLAEVQLGRPPGRHGAEPARACADVAQDHERGRPAVPAVEDVGAARLFANGVQLRTLNHLLEVFEVVSLGDLDADPLGDRRRPEGLA